MEIDWPNQLRIYKSHGIEHVQHLQCSNNDPQYEARVFEACKALHNLVGNNRRVFVHCSSGLVRSPTVVLAYLCIFKRYKNWRNVIETKDFIVEYSHNSIPNSTLVENLVYTNRNFQNQQTDINTEKDLKRRQLIAQYDQKVKIMSELAREKEDRKRKEIER